MTGHNPEGSSNSIDEAELTDLRALERPGNEGFAARIVGVFLRDATKRVADIGEALASDDPAAVAMAAHALKGSCAYVGADRLARLCGTMEELAEGGQLDRGLESQIRRELDEVSAVLKKVVEIGSEGSAALC
ncbi:MAG TPA: Hpt domain-containing protein [Actinomycetota bacterium]|nr:Hpt domain-containing protein [Actinomycetota bacterium]